MKTLKIILLTIATVTLTSCHFDMNFGQTDGNGNVTTETRNVSEDFTKVRGSAGLDVYLTKGTTASIKVEADENLQEIISTEITNGKLHVTTSDHHNIGRAKAKKVYITYVSLDEVASSSGADVVVNGILEAENLTLDSSSGSDLDVEVFAKTLYIDCSSGADIKVSGKASQLTADASSGSEINAKDLLVINCKAEVSSGADITVNVKESLEVDASSGGDVNYYGNPTAVKNNSGKSGSVRKM
ncbi:head GIN domain-containing protein [Rasiella sp. SM2506]|uniref:head GIN domain-containing protein n=1 Tax=Rasiella sp. SM2506 TaxID=3423914 RepID=UPI003D79C3F8